MSINSIKKLFRNPDFLILGFLFILGLLFRLYLIDKNLFFGPEQGRDLLVVKDIVINHNLVLIGSKTDIDGIFHGPIFYYLATIPFFLSKGNPLLIGTFFIFLNSLTVFPLYFLTKELFNKRVALISSVLFTFSFGAIVMARWLSNPPLIILISSLFFLFLAKFLKGKNNYLIPSAICFILAGQAEFLNFIIFSLIIFFVVVVFRKRFLQQKLIHLFLAIGILLFGSVANYILFDLRHNFLITNSLIKLLTKQTGFYGSFVSSATGSVDNFIHLFSDSIIPFFPILAVIIFIFGLFSLINILNKSKIGVYFLLIWIFSPFIVFILLKYNPLYHYFASSLLAIIILVSVLIDKVWSLKRTLGALLVILLLIINFFAWFKYLPINKNVFFQATQPDLKYVDQRLVVEKIYKQANGKPFYFQSYTIPSWMQDGWEYLFWYYGSTKYGYIPENKNSKLLFVIIQDDPGNKNYQNDWLKNTVSKWGEKEGEFRQGALRVEKLKFK